MPTFGALGKSPLASDFQGPVGGVEPTPFFDAVQANWTDGRRTRNTDTRDAQLQERLWTRHRAIEQATGVKLPVSMTLGGVGAKGEPMAGVVDDQRYEAQIAELQSKFPGAMASVPSRRQGLDQLNTELTGVRKRADDANAQGGVAGISAAFIGQGGAAMSDPVNLAATVATGGWGAARGFAARMLSQVAVNAGTEALQIPQRMEDAQIAGPDYTLKEAAQDVTFAGIGGGVFELVGTGARAGFKALRGAAGDAPAVRGALDVVETAARDDLVLGDLPGADHEIALQALATGAPPPRLEPDRDLSELFSGGASSVDYRGRAIAVESFDPATLATDPGRFQYKADGDAEGVTARLKSVEAWDPLAAGRVMVFEDRAGARYIADGHQRFGLVRRLNDERGFDHALDGFLFREADGWKASEVRVMAALKNIREGSGAPLDAAKVFRDAPDALRDRSLPVTGEFMAQARGLASLSDEAFGAVVNRVLPERYAAEIGQMAATRPDLHMDMVRLMKAAEPANGDEARALVMEALQDDWIKGEGQTADLFGYDPSMSAMIGRAKVAASVKRSLARDAKLFSQLVKHADAIEAGGNALARDANQARLAVDRAALEVTAKLALRHGPVGEAMAEAAQRVAKGENPATAAKGVLARVREALEAGERLDDMRGVALAPEPPTASGEALLKGFDDPRGEGAKAQAKAAPEDVDFETGRVETTTFELGDGADGPTFWVRPQGGGFDDHLFGWVDDHSLRIDHANLDEKLRGKGQGVAMYERAAREAFAQGKVLTSDVEVSADAQRVYAALERRGYAVERLPEGKLSKSEDGMVMAKGKEPVYRVISGPDEDGAPPPGLFDDLPQVGGAAKARDALLACIPGA